MIFLRNYVLFLGIQFELYVVSLIIFSIVVLAPIISSLFFISYNLFAPFFNYLISPLVLVERWMLKTNRDWPINIKKAVPGKCPHGNNHMLGSNGAFFGIWSTLSDLLKNCHCWFTATGPQYYTTLPLWRLTKSASKWPVSGACIVVWGLFQPAFATMIVLLGKKSVLINHVLYKWQIQ